MKDVEIPIAHKRLKSLTGPTPALIPDKKAITVVTVAKVNA